MRARLSSAPFRRSSASWRRVCKPATPAASSRDAAARLRLGRDDFVDLALPHQGRRARARGGIGEEDLDVPRADLAAVDAIGRALTRARSGGSSSSTSASLKAAGAVRLAIVEHEAHFGHVARRAIAGTGEKITSSMPDARMLLYEFSPMTQRSASTRFDLPQPFGPTTPVSPGWMSKSLASTKLLKPTRRSLVRCMGARFPSGRQRARNGGRCKGAPRLACA